MKRLWLAAILAGLTGVLLVSCGRAPAPRVVTKVVKETVLATRFVTREVTQTPHRAVTPSPTPQPLPVPTTGLPLEVLFRKPHYSCDKRCVPDWNGVQRRSYRYFQFELAISNRSIYWTIDWNWGPSRWVVTDGARERSVQGWYEWGKRSGGFYRKPEVGPGQSATWTFLLPFINRYEWVKAVEFQAWGHTYRQEFDIGPFKDNDNYTDCGAPHIPRHPREGWSCPEQK